MQRITLASKEVETDDGETETRDTAWVEINSKVQDAVTSRAIEDNLTFGDALVAHLRDELTDE